MTVSNTVTKNTYVLNNATTEFAYTFTVEESSDIHVYLYYSTDGTTTEITSGFSVDTTAQTVTYSAASGYGSDYRLTLSREMELTQSLDLVNQGAFYAEDHETAFDKLTMIAQQQQEELDRCLKYSISSSETDTDPSSFVARIEAGINAAAAAKVSETNAASSAAAAAESETNAADSAASAKTYAALAVSSSASAWSATETYSYPTVVAYTDGYSYRCIGTNVVGEIPPDSVNWVRSAWVANDFFDVGSDGRLMPALSPTYSVDFELGSDGRIMPKV